jgi:hypothetical protein
LLHLANAYGSIPNQVIEHAMDHYHFPDKIKMLIRSFYSNVRLRFNTPDFTTDWIKVERGIVTGCTVSVILFVLGMNLILKAAEQETRGPKMTSGIWMPPTRRFMDDITITKESHIQSRWILGALEKTPSLARIKFKQRMSRYLVLRKGKILPHVDLKIQGEDIRRIIDNPIKCLGKWFDATLNDKEDINQLQVSLSQNL